MKVTIDNISKDINLADFKRTEEAISKKVFLSGIEGCKDLLGFKAHPSKRLLERNKKEFSKLPYVYCIEVFKDEPKLTVSNKSMLQWTLHFNDFDERALWMNANVKQSATLSIEK